ncbi:MAG: hypothetical protein GY780_07705 [bacterium]|nr:hypothetical protein [bacterium]
MKDICVELTGNTNELALMAEMLGASGVNIEGLCFGTNDEEMVIHCLVDDVTTACHVLENSEVKIRDVSEVFVLNKDQKGVTGKPGSFGNICKTLAENGIGINFGYPAENNQFVFGVDDLDRARELLK